LALSPAIDAAFPPLLFILGGRQSARSLHFFGTAVIVLFFVVHILMVIAAGPIHQIRSIITSRFVVPSAPDTKSTTTKQLNDSHQAPNIHAWNAGGCRRRLPLGLRSIDEFGGDRRNSQKRRVAKPNSEPDAFRPYACARISGLRHLCSLSRQW